jgi:hypothetical protein
MNDRRLDIVAIMLLLLLSMGCSGGGRPQIHGTVTYNNKAVGGRTLALSQGEGVDAFTHRIPIKADGTFSGEVPQTGTYQVVIEESLAAQEGRKAPGGEPIPAKYRARNTSDLNWTIGQGVNEKAIVLLD